MLLCGGKSSRMGADKAELELGGRRLIDRAADTLRTVAERVLLASGRDVRNPELGLECVLDEHPDSGPLAGLAAGLAAARTRWVAALACDMPQVRPELLLALAERAQLDGLDGATLRSAKGVEPLCGCYSTACLAAIRAALDRGERRVVAFWEGRDGLRSLRIRAFEPGELDARLAVDAERQALNLNTQEELEHARAASAHVRHRRDAPDQRRTA